MDPAALTQLVQVVGVIVKEIGFPVFVAMYLLLRVDPALRELTRVVHSLSDVLQVANGLTRRTHDPRA